MSRSAQRNLYDSGTGILRNWALLREIGRRDSAVNKWGVFYRRRKIHWRNAR